MADMVSDVTADFSGGQDAYHDPSKIAKNMYAKGVNVSTKGGILSPRDGLTEREPIFSVDFVETSFRYRKYLKDLFTTGKFQAAANYTSSGVDYIVFVISGYILRYSIATKKLEFLSKTIKLNQFARRINWTSAGDYLVFYDFPDFPIHIKGNTVERSNPDNMQGSNRQPEVPISNMGELVNGRLHVANTERAWISGDPTGSQATPNAPITFTEVLEPFQDYTGDSYSLSTKNAGETISAIGFIQSLDTSTGIGPLIIATKNAVYYFRVDEPRSTWSQIKFGGVLLFNVGVSNDRAMINVNSDLILVSGSGKVHALSTARNDAQKWANIAISREVENYLKYRDPDLINISFAGYFNNKIYISANPYRTKAYTSDNKPVADYAHAGMVVLSTDNVASLNAQGTPVWEGLHTAPYFRPLDIITIGNDRAFVIAKNESNHNCIYEIIPGQTFDVVKGKEVAIVSIVYTREYDFETPVTPKNEKAIVMCLNDIQGSLELLVESRAEHSQNFKFFNKFKHNAPYKQCNKITYPMGLSKHSFKDLILGAPDPNTRDNCDYVSGNLLSYFNAVQLRITIKARDWKIKNILLNAILVNKPHLNNTCDNYLEVAIPAQATPDWQLTKMEIYATD